MRPNRVFFPQTLLDTWLADDRVELTGDALLLREEGRRFQIAEAVHVIRDVAGGGDAAKLLGKVKTREQLVSMNAELFESSMVLGDDAYDVIPGFLGEPIGAFASHRSEHSQLAPSPAQNDEELLAQFLMKSL